MFQHRLSLNTVLGAIGMAKAADATNTAVDEWSWLQVRRFAIGGQPTDMDE